MYKGKYDPIPLPEQGYCCITKPGYVCWSPTGGRFDAQKGYKVDHRVSIGKLVPGSRTMMYPNARYFEIFRPELGIRADRPLKAAGDKADEPVKEDETSSGQERKSESAGAYVHTGGISPGALSVAPGCGLWLFMQAVSERSGLIAAVRQCFPGRSQMVLALAMHAVAAPYESLSAFKSWGFLNYAGLRRLPEEAEIRALLGSAPMREALSGLNLSFCAGAAEHEIFALHAGGTGDLTPATAYYLDAETGLPLWCGEYYGILSDAVAVNDFPALKEPLIVLGESCDTAALKRCGRRGYIALLNGTSALIKELIKAHGDKLRTDSSLYQHPYRLCALLVESFQCAPGLLPHAVLTYADMEAAALRQAIYARIEWTSRWLKHRRVLTPWLKQAALPYVSLKELPQKGADGFNYESAVNQDAVSERLSTAGFGAILCSEPLTVTRALELKAIAEDVSLGAREQYLHWFSGLRADAEPQLWAGARCMWLLSLRLRQECVKALRDTGALGDHALPAALAHLSTLQMEHLGQNNTAALLYELTREQQQLLSAAGLNIPEMVARVSTCGPDLKSTGE